MSAAPFLVALIGCTVIAVLAYVFLREDPVGGLVAPTSIRVEGPETVVVHADGPFDGVAEIVQVGYAMGDEEIFLELIVDVDDCDDCLVSESVTATVTLPADVDGRRVRAGTGRALLECTTGAAGTVCADG